MCYHKSSNYTPQDLDEYYQSLERLYGALASEEWAKQWEPIYHENGFDYKLSPVLTNEGWGYLRWGLIPWMAKAVSDFRPPRANTLNAKSEEMFTKNSYRPSLEKGMRCLIPSSGFYESHHNDSKGKTKQANYIHLKEQKIFSFAGIWAKWKEPGTEKTWSTYTIITTEANKLMAEVHNSAKRMPVIIPREYEGDWLSSNLTNDDVLALCKPFEKEERMEAYPVHNRVFNAKMPSNDLQILDKIETGLLF